MRKVAIVSALVLLQWPLSSNASRAQDLDHFKTPSGNIHCQIDPGEWRKGSDSLRCDILQVSKMSQPRPRTCKDDWGRSYSLDDDGDKGHAICSTDSVLNPDNPTLPYGRAWTFGNIRCKSEQAGLTCSNGRGAGFFLSRAKQEVF